MYRIKAILNSSRKASACLLLWSSFQAMLWAFSWSWTSEGEAGAIKAWGFWPFFDLSAPIGSLWIYDISEFFVYGIMPWALYGAYRLWIFDNKKT
jgi:hypothetical protein